MNEQLSLFEASGFAGDLGLPAPKARSVELWRTDRGSILLHHPTSGKDNDWVEIAPEAIPWLIERLREI